MPRIKTFIFKKMPNKSKKWLGNKSNTNEIKGMPLKSKAFLGIYRPRKSNELQGRTRKSKEGLGSQRHS